MSSRRPASMLHTSGSPASSSLRKKSSVRDSSTSSSSSGSKRHSIFPWTNKRSSGLGTTSHNNYYSERLPVISDPILEFSTADFFTSTGIESEKVRASRPVPVITNYPPSQHAINTRNSMFEMRRASSSSQQQPNISQGRSPTTPTSPRVPAPPPPLDGPRRPSTSSVSSMTSTATSNATASTDLDLKRKLRESEQKNVTLMVDYQKKLDKSRKRILELEKALHDEQKTVRELRISSPTKVSLDGVTTPPATPLPEQLPTTPDADTPDVSMSTSPVSAVTSPNKEQLTQRIAQLESQKESLRQALKDLRITKDLEIKHHQDQVSRLKKLQLASLTSSSMFAFNSMATQPTPLKLPTSPPITPTMASATLIPDTPNSSSSILTQPGTSTASNNALASTAGPKPRMNGSYHSLNSSFSSRSSSTSSTWSTASTINQKRVGVNPFVPTSPSNTSSLSQYSGL